MANLKEKVPGEFTDDERWYRFFTLKTLIAFAAGALIDFALTLLFAKVNAAAFGFVLGTMILIAIVSFVAVKWPMVDTLHGGGKTLLELSIALAAHRRNRAVYVRMHRKGEE